MAPGGPWCPAPVRCAAHPGSEKNLPSLYTLGMWQPSEELAADVQQPVLHLLERNPPGASPLGRAVVMSCAPIMQELVAQARASGLPGRATPPHLHPPIAPQPESQLPSCRDSAPLLQTATSQSDLVRQSANAHAESVRTGGLGSKRQAAAAVVTVAQSPTPARAPGDHVAAACDPPDRPHACELRAQGGGGGVAAPCKRTRPATLDTVSVCDTPVAPQRARPSFDGSTAHALDLNAQEAAQAGQAANTAQPELHTDIGSTGKPTRVNATTAHHRPVSAAVGPGAGVPDAKESEPSRQRVGDAQALCAVACTVQRAAQHDEAGRASGSEWEPCQGGEPHAATASATMDSSETESCDLLRRRHEAARRGQIQEADSGAPQCSRECAQSGSPRYRATPGHANFAAQADGSQLASPQRPAAQRVAEPVASPHAASTGRSDKAMRTCSLCNTVKPQAAMLQSCDTRCKECTSKMQKLHRNGYSFAEAAAALRDGSGDKVCTRKTEQCVSSKMLGR